MKIKHVLTLLFICLAGIVNAQKTDSSAPYIQHPELPAFKIQMLDSTTIFNTYNIKPGKKTVLMLFSPDCEHCQHMADSMKAHMDELKTANIYMFSFTELKDIKEFAEKYKLNKQKNITFGKDKEFFFAGFYKLTAVPGIAIYDEKKQFMKLFNGGAKIGDVTSVINNLPPPPTEIKTK